MPYFEIFGKNRDAQAVCDSANSEITFLWLIAELYLVTNWFVWLDRNEKPIGKKLI